MIIISDSQKAPDGYVTSHYNEFWVHYDPDEDGAEEMIANAAGGDDEELLANAIFDTRGSRAGNSQIF
jgi:hypothetical protein